MLKESTTLIREVAHSTPPAVYVASTYMGHTWSEWSAIAITVFTFFQIVRLLPKMYSCMLCFSRAWKCKKTCTQTK